jgi:hypothetical protein
MSLSVRRPIDAVKTFTIGLAVSLMLFIAAGIGSAYAANVTFNSTRNCNVNSIINCGAMSVSELQSKYNADAKAQSVYAWYGIDRNEINNLPNTAVAGTAHKNGEVRVGGKVVATDAISAGYNNRPGRQQATHNGVTFYNSASQNVFASDSLDAYVVLDSQGKFRYAILASCGNPMKAKNVVQPKEQPKPEQPKPEQPKPEQPKPEQPKPEQPKPEAPKPVQPVVEQPAPEVLPESGAGSVAALFTGVSALAGAGHALYLRSKRNRDL